MSAQGYEVGKFVGGFMITIKISGWSNVMYREGRKSLLRSALSASVPIALSGFFGLFWPVFAAVAILATLPVWVVGAISSQALSRTLHRAKPGMGIAFSDDEFSTTMFTNLFESCLFSCGHRAPYRAIAFIGR